MPEHFRRDGRVDQFGRYRLSVFDPELFKLEHFLSLSVIVAGGKVVGAYCRHECIQVFANSAPE